MHELAETYIFLVFKFFRSVVHLQICGCLITLHNNVLDISLGLSLSETIQLFVEWKSRELCGRHRHSGLQSGGIQSFPGPNF